MRRAAAEASSRCTDAMRVGIDGSSWVSRRGYGRFLRNAGSALMELDDDTDYVVYIDEQSAAKARLPARAERRLVALRHPAHDSAMAESRRGAADIMRMTIAVSRDRPDVFMFPSLHTYFPVFGVPTVLGIHDTIPEDYPELTHPGRRARGYATLKRALAMRRTTRLFTVSEASRTAVAQRFGLAPEDLPIVPEAPDPVFHPRPTGDVEHALAPLGLTAGSFLVSACGISPHKNLERLVEAYVRVLRELPNAPPLVIVGDLERDPYLSAVTSVVRTIGEHSLEERVVLPGFVSDETLACLYVGATAVVVPSLAEGFGLPAVEAAASGTALVLSDLPAHRETLDGAAVFVPPTDIGAIARALVEVIADPMLRASLGERARNAVSSLSWAASARALHAVITETARSGGNRRG
jgi:glycosyltransferase involved in cell wall biosynthesis